MATVDPAPLAVSPKQAAAMLGVGRSKIFEMLAAGQLHARKLGNRTLIEAASVRSAFDRLPPARPAKAACRGFPTDSHRVG